MILQIYYSRSMYFERIVLMVIESIDNGKDFDWGITSNNYAKYRDIYPKELYERLKELGVAKDGTSWLDLGTGTGVLPKNLYNENANITAIDITKNQIEYARVYAKNNGLNINYIVSSAENTNFLDNSFDCITAAQCFWYFDRDKMITEIKRMLKPNGKFIKIYMTYVLEDEIALKSHNLVKSINKNWTPEASGSKDMFDDLFEGRVTESFYCNIPFSRESWHGRMCACRGTLASMDKETFKKWDELHKEFLANCPKEFSIKHKVYITYFDVK